MGKSKSKRIGMLFLTLVTVLGIPFSFNHSSRAEASTSDHSSNGASVQAWLTDIPSNTWIKRQNDIAFEPKKADQALTISIDENRKYQSVLGFGAALSDSSGWLIGNKMSETQQSGLMKSLFSPKDGIGLNLVRLPMGATDLSASGDYSYDDLEKGKTDPTLSNFSIKHDMAYIIPELKQALSLNKSTQIMANPWSPPGWMKTSDSMEGGTLKTEDYTVLANYFVKFIQDYKAAGVPLAFISPQNEPQYTGGYPGMMLSASQESQLIQDIGQAFKENDISTQILSWDHNWDMPAYPEQIYRDPASSQYTPATAWHCYGGDVTAQSTVHNDYPEKGALITECSGGTWQGDTQTAFKDELDNLVINGMRNWAQGVMLWNLALDTNHGPTNKGCLTCNGLVTIDQNTGKYTYNTDYYALGQASKFVKAGAHRVYSNTFGEGSIEDIAFVNPEGSKVLIAYNSGDKEKMFSVADGTRSFDYSLKAGDAVTFKWSGPPQNGDHSQAATNVQDQTHDFTFKSSSSDEPITVIYDPALMTNANAFLSNNKLTDYTLPYGASIQNTQKENALDRTDWKVTSSSSSGGDVISNTIDGNPSTRWSSGHGQTSGDWVQINLGSSKNFNKISLDTGPNNAGDYVRQYQVFVSNDGVKWENAIINGTGNGESLDITLPTQTAQYIRLVNTGSSGSWWSIGEINVYAPQNGTDAASISGPVSVPSGLQMKTWQSSTNTEVTVVYNGSGRSQSFPISTDNAVMYTLPAGGATLFTSTDKSDLQKPVVSDLSPNSGIAGQTVSIHGTHFGNGQGLGTVYFGSTPVTISSWSDTSISVMVPRGLDAGTLPVSVYGSNGLSAGSVSFTLKNPTPFQRTGWTITASDVSPYGDGPEKMLDGDLNTRYSSGKGMYNGGWIMVDMGQQQTFNALVLDSGPSTGDYSRSADLYVSTDGTNWTKVTSVVGTGPLVSFTFPGQTARYIKVVNTSESGSWWSIAEFNVYNEQ